ncbi:MAG: TrmH family RNA methyltransferase [Spirochaetales bacterium]|nr:TrmH family RNA methyltransferase [Spirochaetales bacterium]
MITVRKLARLKPRLRARKTAGIFHMYARRLEQNENPDLLYLKDIFSLVLKDEQLSALHEKIAAKIGAFHQNAEPVRCLDSLSWLLLSFLGEGPADWDLQYRKGTAEPVQKPFSLYLDDVRSPFNIGSIFRTADSFGVSRILLSPDCPSPDHPRCRRTAMGCAETVPWEYSRADLLTGPVFALELGGTEITAFDFPPAGTMIIGSEEAGISAASRNMAEASCGLVSIPTHGNKGSLNLSVAAGIALFHWDSRF